MSRIKSALYGNAYETNTGVMDAEAYHEMDVRDMDREEMEKEITADIATADEASQTVVEIQEAVEVLATNVEEMNPVEVGKAIGAIEDKLETVAENVEEAVVDTEALASGNLPAGVRKELEAISDKLKSAWEAIKKFFRGIWEKIKQLSRSLILWITDSSKKSKDLLEKLSKVSELKSDLDYKSIADRIGTKMAIIIDTSSKPEVVINVLDTVKTLEDPANAPKAAYQQVFYDLLRKSSDYKTSFNITDEHNILVTRFNGNTIKFIAVASDGTYAGYHSAVMTPSTNARYRENIAKRIANGDFNIKIITGWLEAVPSISAKIKALNEASAKILTELHSTISKDIDNAKFKQGMFKTIWSKTLGHKSADQYTAEDTVKAYRNMTSAITNGVSDSLFGGNALIKEINSIATIILSCYKDKSEN